MAENTASTPLQQLSNLSELHIVRQLVLLAGLAGSIALGVAVVLWSQGSDYRLLGAGMSTDDAVRAVTLLEQNGMDHQVDLRSGEVSVPDSDWHKARMLMATAGLLEGASGGGWDDLLNRKQDIGDSTTIQQARINRARTLELEKTIESMDTIRAARVHLSVPRSKGFIMSRMKPSASVMVTPLPGATLSDMQIAGIRHLVAASAPGLDSENVSVVDHRGTLLSTDDGSDFAQSNRQMGVKQELEQYYVDKILSLLTPVVGYGRVHAQVSADVDFTRVETTEEDYGPEGVLRSEQVLTEETTQEADLGGVPGLLEDDLNANPDGLEEEPDKLKSKADKISNWEIDRIIKSIKRSPGGIQRLSVAVLIDTPETAAGAQGEGESGETAAPQGVSREELIALVEGVVGFDEERGDVLSLVDTNFYQEPEAFVAEEPGLMENPMLWKGLRMGGAGLVVLLLIFGVLRPVLKSSVAQNGALPRRGSEALPYPGGAEGYEEGFQPDDQVTLTGGNPGNRLAGPNAARAYESNLAQVKAIVENEPDKAARVIQGWVAND